MYGLIHEAFRELVVESHGDARWEAVLVRAGLGQESFVSMQVYDDLETFKLVGAIADELATPAPEILERLGERFIPFVEARGFGSLLALSGRDLIEFLRNVDQLHSRVVFTLPHVRAPSFAIIDDPDGSVRLVYRSERAGLAPLVRGLITGLSKRFAEPVDVDECPVQPGEPLEFRLRRRSSEALAS